MWRIPSERVTLGLDGPSVEVERIFSDIVQFEGFRLLNAFMAASTPEANYASLAALFDFFLTEARPTWDVEDHRGHVPESVNGMRRLGTQIATGIVALWLNTYQAPAAATEEPESAADALLPPAVAKQVKSRLKAVA